MSDINPSKCPLCGNMNHCVEVAKAQGETVKTPCWCIDAQFPPELLDKVPVEAKNQACICENCVKGIALATEVN